MIEYMSFKAYYSNVGPKEEIPVNELTERLPPEIVLELSVTFFHHPISITLTILYD